MTGSANILVTGATGFVGRRVVDQLVVRPEACVLAVVRTEATLPNNCKMVRIEGVQADTDWRGDLFGVDVVIHAAARAHTANDPEHDTLAAFRAVNVAGTLNLARQAAEAGVRRFIFISSIGVNGASSVAPFTEQDSPATSDSYSISKLEAEQGLFALSSATGMEIVVIRPPLVYGPGAPGNFGKLVRAVQRGRPLPLGAVEHNRRTLVALDNLVDLIVTCIDHPAAANQVFLAGDAEDLSTTELLRRMGRAMGRPVRLLPVPVAVLRGIAGLVGREQVIEKLCGNLQVDISKARELLGWSPPISVDEGLRRCFE